MANRYYTPEHIRNKRTLRKRASMVLPTPNAVNEFMDSAIDKSGQTVLMVAESGSAGLSRALTHLYSRFVNS